jgi:hypothetical protein
MEKLFAVLKAPLQKRPLGGFGLILNVSVIGVSCSNQVSAGMVSGLTLLLAKLPACNS